VANGASLTRFAWLSIAAACVTIGLKGGAYLLTGSVGLLSDALESLVNLVAAVVALVALTVAAREAHEEHAFGHEKAEYFSSGIEGGLILLAAFSIIVTAVQRLLHPEPVSSLGAGLAVSTLASLINLGVAIQLRRAGSAYESITLEADAQHLMTDVWTSAGVLIGVGAVGLTGWEWLDPGVALLVAANIIHSGLQLVRRAALGLLDTAIPLAERAAVQAVLDRYVDRGIRWHALRTRHAGARRFISVHVLVPDDWTVRRGHDLLEAIERDVRVAVRGATVFTHLEPLEDPTAWDDLGLDRPAGSGRATQESGRGCDPPAPSTE
jgi:cation diffusion facilitator family transporter